MGPISELILYDGRTLFPSPLVATTLAATAIARGGDAVTVEDYCHAVEHSIEFQVLFLQHRLSPGVRVVPILCGPFVAALEEVLGELERP